MATAYFLTHPDVLIDPAVPVPDWPLSPRGRQRMRQALVQPWVSGIRAIWSSPERKARDGADLLAAYLGLPVTELAGLGENDRSATGYLPRSAFEAMADLFFAHPQESIRGWERAVDAQRRIVAAVDHVLAGHGPADPALADSGPSATRAGDVAIVAHGAVGALLLCHLRGKAITRADDQPPGHGGNYFAFDVATRQLRHGWRPIDA